MPEFVITTPTPLQELLTVHPAPWQCKPYAGWRGKDLPDQVIYDGHCRLVDICDDPEWRSAIVQAINAAAGTPGCEGK